MKTYTYIFLIAIITLLAACKKDSTEPVSIYNRWQLAGYYTGGSNAAYLAATDKSVFIQFYTDGTVIENTFNNNYQTFTADGTYITLSKPDLSFKLFYHIKNDTLTMNSVGCTVGCDIVFVRSNGVYK